MAQEIQQRYKFKESMARESQSTLQLRQRAMRTESRLHRRIRRHAENKALNPAFRPASAKDRVNSRQVIEEALSLLRPRPATAHVGKNIASRPGAGERSRAARHQQHINTSKIFLQRRAEKRRQKEKDIQREMRRERWKRLTICERQIADLNRWASEEGMDGQPLDPSLKNKKFAFQGDLDLSSPRNIASETEPMVRVTTIGNNGSVKYERLLDLEEFSKLYQKHKAVMDHQMQELQAKRTYMELCATTSEDVQANLESLLKAAMERTEELQRQMNYISACGWNQ